MILGCYLDVHAWSYPLLFSPKVLYICGHTCILNSSCHKGSIARSWTSADTLRESQRQMKFSIDWNFQSRSSEFPTKKWGLGSVARLKILISLEISIPEGDLEFFSSFGPLGKSLAILAFTSPTLRLNVLPNLRVYWSAETRLFRKGVVCFSHSKPREPQKPR